MVLFCLAVFQKDNLRVVDPVTRLLLNKQNSVVLSNPQGALTHLVQPWRWGWKEDRVAFPPSLCRRGNEVMKLGEPHPKSAHALWYTCSRRHRIPQLSCAERKIMGLREQFQTSPVIPAPLPCPIPTNRWL